MPIHVRWQNEAKTILAFMYEGNWDIHDFYQATDQGNILLDEATNPVVLVLDVQGSRMIPLGFMGALKNMSMKSHPKAGMVVMVGVNLFARAFVNTFRKVYPEKSGERHIYFAANYDEVQTIMQSHLIQSHPE